MRVLFVGKIAASWANGVIAAPGAVDGAASTLGAAAGAWIRTAAPHGGVH